MKKKFRIEALSFMFPEKFVSLYYRYREEKVLPVRGNCSFYGMRSRALKR